jgi:hypothetical protein
MRNDFWPEIAPLLANQNPSQLGEWVEAQDEALQVRFAAQLIE